MTPANSLSWTAFVMTLAALTSPPVLAELSQAPDSASLIANPIEHRLSRITNTLKATEVRLSPEQIPMTGLNGGEGSSGAGGGFANAHNGGGGFANTRGPGWANTAGGGAFGNSRGPGWVNGSSGGAFVNNANPWRNAWADGGGFLNRY
ncbi:GrrA/OscA1 family cyclophane-containing rSAM-modified RiPP [Thermosynechococcaceae cyanobacterium BACA0444]|uniref:GrrA/OscA1 family cyclophane-containing rSAM-modified RiPP n=1 Tax=Pseudocalidococcus azoricus BACA0444 TaxID=2918990 RepID=A0AAE4FV79_9CYAN|nr:GrrA/OscA1 family cyclophane-containing rSAM-modified RiPP [Pseudocalidococcus azoricus]MDS3862478.1 GrrA/OscA1 family cyclophane-containing rSAM-modified RiPP [Pseudocalidococcus azoricus BACA0444]